MLIKIAYVNVVNLRLRIRGKTFFGFCPRNSISFITGVSGKVVKPWDGIIAAIAL